MIEKIDRTTQGLMFKGKHFDHGFETTRNGWCCRRNQTLAQRSNSALQNSFRDVLLPTSKMICVAREFD
jgi:hypothetical protein